MELDSQQLYTDAVTAELAKELQNGRLLRLLVKLSTVTERPEHDGQPQWSETGARGLRAFRVVRAVPWEAGRSTFVFSSFRIIGLI